MQDFTAQEEERRKSSGEEDTPETDAEQMPSLENMEAKNDIMEVPRMKRRLAQTENELKRTRTKLLNSQATLKVVDACSHNGMLITSLVWTQ